MHIDAALSPAEIDLLPQSDLSATVCIVFDVLRATSSILTALAHGTREIRPALTIEEALAVQAQSPDFILAGERFGDCIPGFDLGNSPQEYARPGLERIVTTTTNGTVALRACAAAQAVWVGALLNMQALEERLRGSRPERVMLVCAGTFREPALEDILAAGMLTEAFPQADCSDAAQTARAVYREHRADLPAALRRAKNGRALIQNGRAHDVEYCAAVSRLPVVGLLSDGIIRAD